MTHLSSTSKAISNAPDLTSYKVHLHLDKFYDLWHLLPGIVFAFIDTYNHNGNQ